MSCCLEHVDDWDSLARKCGYRVSEVASTVNVSTRTIETFFVNHFQRSPRIWLEQLKWADACALLLRGYSMKCIAHELGYAHPRNFCRGFRNRFGQSPRVFLKSGRITSQNETHPSLLSLKE